MPEVNLMPISTIIGLGLDAVEEAVTQADEDLVGKQMEAAPVKTGTLRAGIHIESIERTGDEVIATNSTGGESSAYAIRVHEGGDEYPIEAKDGGYLYWPDAEHPVKRVTHPASVGNPFMTRPLLENIATYERAMAEAAASRF